MMETQSHLNGLDHPAYHQAVRLPKYNGPVTCFQAVSIADAAKVLRRMNSTWNISDHVLLAQQHADAANRSEAEWHRLVQKASIETFGRPYRITDYRISGIACDEFSEAMKQALSTASRASSNHHQVSLAHAYAARRRWKH